MNNEEMPEEFEEGEKQAEGEVEGSKEKREIILKKAGNEYFSAGEDELQKERYNSAVVLFFKALTSFCDLYLLRNTGRSPSSHTDRFRVTQSKFPEIYEVLDKNFPFYQESYKSILSEELAENIKNDAKNMAKKVEIEI